MAAIVKKLQFAENAETYEVKTEPEISTEPNNAIVVKDDGLFAEKLSNHNIYPIGSYFFGIDGVILPQGVLWENKGKMSGTNINMYERITNGLTFIAEQANSSVSLTKIGSPNNIILEYSLDGISWQDYTISNIIRLSNIGDTVIFRNKSSQNISYSFSDYYKFVMTGKIAASRSINYLYRKDGSNFALNGWQYHKLFYGCSSLTKAPELPATTVSVNCYSSMFYDCTSLTKAPELPATDMNSACYQNMFYNCSSLIIPPSLLHTTTDFMYEPFYQMFMNCSKLKVRNSSAAGATKFFIGDEMASIAAYEMFGGTGGTFKGSPNDGESYYWYL